jgi:hypothetical protein
MVVGEKMFDALCFRKLLLLILVLTVSITILFAGKRNYGEFLLVDIGARPTSLGGAYIAVADDIFSMEYNPAGTSLFSKREFAFTHIEYIGGATIDYIAHKRNIKDKFGLGLSLKMFSITDSKRNDFGLKTGEFKNKNILLNFNISHQIRRLNYGVNIKYLHEEIFNKSFGNVLLDLGVLRDFNVGTQGNYLRTAIVVSNAGMEAKYEEAKFSAPVNMKAGISYYSKLFDNDLLLTLELQSKDFFKIFGIEYYVTDYFAVRTGFSGSSLSNDIQDFNFGVGLIEKIGTINYSYKSFSDLGNSHSISLTIRY